MCDRAEIVTLHLESITVTFILFQISHSINSVGTMSYPVAEFVLFISSILHYLTALGLITAHATNWASGQFLLKTEPMFLLLYSTW